MPDCSIVNPSYVLTFILKKNLTTATRSLVSSSRARRIAIGPWRSLNGGRLPVSTGQDDLKFKARPGTVVRSLTEYRDRCCGCSRRSCYEGGQFLSFSLGIAPIRRVVSHMWIRFVAINLAVSRIVAIFGHSPPSRQPPCPKKNCDITISINPVRIILPAWWSLQNVSSGTASLDIPLWLVAVDSLLSYVEGSLRSFFHFTHFPRKWCNLNT